MGKCHRRQGGGRDNAGMWRRVIEAERWADARAPTPPPGLGSLAQLILLHDVLEPCLCAQAPPSAQTAKKSTRKSGGAAATAAATRPEIPVPATRAATAATPQDGILSPGDTSTSPNVTRRRKRAVEDGNWRLCRSRLAFLALSVSLSYGRAPK